MAHLRRERHARGIVVKLCGRIVVPIESPAFDALQHVLEILQVRLFHPLVFTTAVHFAVLYCSQSVDGFVLVEGEGLRHTVGTRVISLAALLETTVFLPEQGLALRRGE